MSNDDAWALLSLKSQSASSMKSKNHDVIKNENGQRSANGESPIAKLETREFEYMITQKRIVIGRNSNKGDVDVNMGNSTFISRKHVEIFYQDGCFNLICNGKNGIFVDGVFHRKAEPPFPLPRTSIIRFPSTNIKIAFQSMIEDSSYPSANNCNNSVSKNNNSQHIKDTIRSQPIKMAPLKVTIPEHTEQDQFMSPIPSPTGTISAANSCPASPRSNRYRPTGNSELQTMVSYVAAHAEDQNNLHQTVYTSQPGLINLNDSNVANIVNIQTNQIHNQNSSHDYYSVSSNQQLQVAGDSAANSPGEGDEAKPPYSYAQLIVQAISSAPEKQLTLSGIYAYITRKYPYYTIADKGWQNSIRHNLSLNRYFLKVPRSQEEPGKGSFWKIDPNSENKLIEQSFKRRRQRPLTCFRKDNSRSAPASPSQLNSGTVSGLVTPESLSRESSPPPELIEAHGHHQLANEQAIALTSIMGPPNHSHLAGLHHPTMTTFTIPNNVTQAEVQQLVNASRQQAAAVQGDSLNLSGLSAEQFKHFTNSVGKTPQASGPSGFTITTTACDPVLYNTVVNNQSQLIAAAGKASGGNKVMVTTSQLYTTTNNNGDKEQQQLFHQFSSNCARPGSTPRAIALENNTVILQPASSLTTQPNVIISSTPPPSSLHPQQPTRKLTPASNAPQPQSSQFNQQVPNQPHTVIVHAPSTQNSNQLVEIVNNNSIATTSSNINTSLTANSVISKIYAAETAPKVGQPTAEPSSAPVNESAVDKEPNVIISKEETIKIEPAVAAAAAAAAAAAVTTPQPDEQDKLTTTTLPSTGAAVVTSPATGTTTTSTTEPSSNLKRSLDQMTETDRVEPEAKPDDNSNLTKPQEPKISADASIEPPAKQPTSELVKSESGGSPMELVKPADKSEPDESSPVTKKLKSSEHPEIVNNSVDNEADKLAVQTEANVVVSSS